MKISKFVSAIMAMVMVLCVLSGCDIGSKPKTTEDLLKLSVEAMGEADNYEMDMNMSLNIDLDGDMGDVKVKFCLPIEAELAYARSGNYTHTTMEMEAGMDATVSFGDETESNKEDFSSCSEMYMVVDGDTVTTYTNTDEEGWEMKEEDLDEGTYFVSDLLNKDVLSSAKMSKGSGSYNVTADMSDILSNESFLEFVESEVSDSLDGFEDLDWEEISAVLKGVEVVYTFDDDTYRLTSIEVAKTELDDLDLLGELIGEDLDAMEVESLITEFSLSVKIHGYDEVDVSDAKVPRNVKKEAEDSDFVIIDPEPYEPEYTEPNTSEPEATESKPTVSTDEKVFYYKGSKLDMPVDPDVFTADGWYPVEDGQYSSFVCMENEKYPDVTLYLFQRDGNGTFDSVKKMGADGFDLTYTGYKSEYPDISFGNVTIGSSKADVLALMGDPKSFLSDDDWESLTWEFEYDGKECELSIVIGEGEVRTFELSSWF